MYGSPTRNQDHPQNKHNEDNRNTIGLSPGELQGAKWRQLKRRNQAKAKNMLLSKQCLYMMTKPQKKLRKSKEHGEKHNNELPLVFHGADRAEQQPGTSRNKGHAA